MERWGKVGQVVLWRRMRIYPKYWATHQLQWHRSLMDFGVLIPDTLGVLGLLTLLLFWKLLRYDQFHCWLMSLAETFVAVEHDAPLSAYM
eukprot:3987439-Amphidinium_carterae.1